MAHENPFRGGDIYVSFKSWEIEREVLCFPVLIPVEYDTFIWESPSKIARYNHH